MLRALMTDCPWADTSIERSILEAAGIELVEASNGDESTLSKLAPGCQAIMTCWAKVTAKVIDAAPQLRHVARLGIGLDNIDVAHATTRRVLVTNVPDYCLDEVVEHTLALLLGLARNVGVHVMRMRQGEYAPLQGIPLRRMRGKTLGILGFGRIGQLLRTSALGLGMRVIAHSASNNDRGTGCSMVTLEELFRQSDFLSLHAPLTPLTRHIVNRKTLSLMPPQAILINTSRGGLVDHEALQLALESRQLAGAGLDVFDPEPPNLKDPLFQSDRLMATPHIAFASAESLANLRERTAQQVVESLHNRQPENTINPQVLQIR